MQIFLNLRILLNLRVLSNYKLPNDKAFMPPHMWYKINHTVLQNSIKY